MKNLEYICDICKSKYQSKETYNNVKCCDYPLWYSLNQTDWLSEEQLQKDYSKYIIDFHIAIIKEFETKVIDKQYLFNFEK